MILAVDCGNSRVKWGLHDGNAWLRTGTVPLSGIESLKNAWRNIPPAATIVVANVAGPSVRKRLERVFSRKKNVIWPRAKRSQCGVRNGYGKPAQLGADRWAALVAARSLVRGACLVVVAGTATTVDALKSDGTFAGGLILPGLELMKRSLAQSTHVQARAHRHQSQR